MAQWLVVTTSLGAIRLRLHPEAAPQTVAHIVRLANSKLFDGAATFYRSDFVIQCGLHGSSRTNPHADLAVNESNRPGRLSNTRGAAAVAHWDVPDCGNCEWFISLKDNSHLNSAYGGYCVFASVEAGDAASWRTVDAIAAAVPAGKHPAIASVEVV